MDSIGNRIADQKINNGGNRPVGKDFDKGIHLVFTPHGTNFQKCESGVHSKNHHGSKQQEQNISAML